MLKKNLFTILSFKIVWLSCFFGEIYFSSLVGFVVGVIFLGTFIFFQQKKLLIIKKIFIFSFIGYSFDSLLSFLGFYKINAQINFLFLPLWFLVLWPCFSCLLIDVLKFLKYKKIFITILGAIFGPLSYYAGISAGLASVSSMTIFILMSFFWAMLMFSYAKFF